MWLKALTGLGRQPPGTQALVMPSLLRFYSSTKNELDSETPSDDSGLRSWDDFLGDGSEPRPEARYTPSAEATSSKVPRSALYAEERKSVPLKMQYKRRQYDTSALTASETAQFRRIFELLEREVNPESAGSSKRPQDLASFAHRNALAAGPQKLTGRGGGFGVRFAAAKEGLAASLSQQEFDAGMDQLWEDLRQHASAQELWVWAEEHIWQTESEEPAKYGLHTAFYAPALHMLLVTLRDRFHAPHIALSVLKRTRDLGPHSFVLGCTASLYAETIRTQWMCLRDGPGVLKTVQEARSTGILVPVHEEISSKRDDAVLRDQLERIRAEMRGQAMHAARSRLQTTVSKAPQVSMLASENDQLRIASDLRVLAGRTSRYADNSKTLHVAKEASRAPKTTRGAESRNRIARQESKSAKKTPFIFDYDPRTLLRTKVRRIQPRDASK